MIYSKQPTTIPQQIAQLRLRGLIINNQAIAEHYLSNVGYYRLAGYWWPLQSDKINHVFKSNSRFETVVALYNFDRELRILVFDAIEKIEIGLRSKLINKLSLEVSPWWFEDLTIFKSHPAFLENLVSMDRELERSKEIFLKEHKRKYHSDTRRPPSWKSLEIVSFGTLSMLYGNLNSNVLAKNSIAVEMGTVNHTFLPSWLQSIAQIRNICAHHGRLWNKKLPGRPKLLPNPPNPWIKNVPPVSDHHMLYIHLCCIKYILNSIAPGNHFTSKIAFLLTKYPNIDLKALGFPADWHREKLWEHRINESDFSLTSAMRLYL